MKITKDEVIYTADLARLDEVKESMGADKALANAPEKEDGNFIVPKIINA